jgi:hypothetical protein
MRRLISVMCATLLVSGCNFVDAKEAPPSRPLGAKLASQDVPEPSHEPLVASPVALRSEPETATPAMPTSEETCRKIEGGYCIFDTGWKATAPNRYLEPLTDEDAKTDGAGCIAVDSRGNTVASLVPQGPVLFRYQGRLYTLQPNDAPDDDNYFSHYGTDDQAFGFKYGHPIAQGLENKVFPASAQLLIDRKLLSVEVRLECGA